MNIAPSPEFLEACRRILGGDDPATVLTALRDGDPRLDEVRALHADILEEQRTGKPSVMHRTDLRMRQLKSAAADEVS